MSFWREFPLDDGTQKVLIVLCAIGLILVLVCQLGLPRGWWG